MDERDTEDTASRQLSESTRKWRTRRNRNGDKKGKGKWIPANRTASGVRFGYWKIKKEVKDE